MRGNGSKLYIIDDLAFTSESRMPDLTLDDLDTNKAVGVERQLQFFRFSHLRPDLQSTSRMFAHLAVALVNTLPRNPERTDALKLLIQAKDVAVRSCLADGPAPVRKQT